MHYMLQYSCHYLGFMLVCILIAGCNCSNNSNAKTTGTETTSAETPADTETAVQATDPGIDWITIYPGTFTFGSPKDTPMRAKYDEEQVEVTLTRAFLMAKTEVTQKQWTTMGYPNPAITIGDDIPITLINFYEAAAWCNALSRFESLEECYDLSSCTGEFAVGCPEEDNTGCSCHPRGCHKTPNIYSCTQNEHKYPNFYECPGYRMPTTAEWEYAARAGTTTHTYNGNVIGQWAECIEEPVLNDIAWYCHNSGDVMHEVAGKQPNPWGLYDMLGNVFEWVDYFTDGLDLAYHDGHPDAELLTDPIGTQEGESKDIRGGHSTRVGLYCRSAYQFPSTPDTRRNATGFRPVRTLFKIPPRPDSGVTTNVDSGK